jgi:alpha-beta hydrolase superfamily lysophospholipase
MTSPKASFGEQGDGGSRPGGENLTVHPIYFEGTKGTLFGHWHLPPLGEVRGAVVVLVGPLAHEYMYSYRSVRYLGDRLAAAGFHVLRYEHLGTGNSADYSGSAGLVAAWRDDVRIAVACARRWSGSSHATVVGLRAGGTLALAAAQSGVLAQSLVLWCASASGRSFAREFRALSGASAAINGERIKDSGDAGSASFAGFSLSSNSLEELNELGSLPLSRTPAGQILIVSRDDRRSDEALPEQLDALSVPFVRMRMSGYQEMMMEPLYSEVPREMIDSIVTWSVTHAPADHTADVTASWTDAARSLLIQHDDGPIRETPVTFGSEGTLFAIVVEPAYVAASGRRATPRCVVLLNTGGDHHVGPNRLYVHFAREWAALGFIVLRMDLRGLGESSHVRADAQLEAYPLTALGDIRAAISYLSATHGTTEVVLAGMCSGALHAVWAALGGLPVAAVIAINPQFQFQRSAPTRALATDSERYRIHRALFNDEQLALRDRIRFRLRFAKRSLTSALMQSAGTLIDASQSLAERALRRTTPARVTFLNRHCPTLLVFSEGDPGLYFLETRATLQLARLRGERLLRFETIHPADHTFTYPAAQQSLLTLLTEYLVAIGDVTD